MAWVMGALQIAGGVTTAMSQRKEGAAAYKEGLIEADQIEGNAKQSEAYGQRRAIEERRQARLVASRAQAVAAASGGGTDGTAEKIISDIHGEGEYRALLQLYEGDETARGMRAQAGAVRRGGKASQIAGNRAATATVLSSASSLYDKYG